MSSFSSYLSRITKHLDPDAGMTIVPKQSRVPLAPPLAMSTAQDFSSSAAPSATTSSGEAAFSPLPPRPVYNQREEASGDNRDHDHFMKTTLASRVHVKKPSWSKPRLLFEIRDASHMAARLFFRAFVTTELLEDVVDAVLTTLYGSPLDEKGQRDSRVAPVRSITLILRSMDGVAYTCGNDTLGDSEHKQIHFNLEHIKNVYNAAKKEAEDRNKKRKEGNQKSNSDKDEDPEEFASRRAAAEFHGVLVHEMVHCWQWNGQGTAPGGLIEGIADYVRLKESLAPPHWDKSKKGDRWDAGYQTTAFFLEWCEQESGGQDGEGKVRELNGWLKANRWNGDDAWKHIFGRSVAELWKEYTTA